MKLIEFHSEAEYNDPFIIQVLTKVILSLKESSLRLNGIHNLFIKNFPDLLRVLYNSWASDSFVLSEEPP